MNLQELSNEIERAKGGRERVQKQILGIKSDISLTEKDLRIDEAAQIIIKAIAQKTQKTLQYKISEPVTLALKAVFDNPYELSVEFVPRRDKIEADIKFRRNGNLLNPIYASGLGPVDIAANIGLRIACLTMAAPRPRYLLLLDEPLKHLRGYKENIRAIQMIKEISQELKPQLQVIMVNDERVPFEEIEKGADQIISVGIKNGVSYAN